jgi:hypothetical protein
MSKLELPEPPELDGRDRRCEAVKRDGSPCRAWPITDERFCFFHAPEKASEREAAQRRGGRGNRAPLVSADAPDLALNDADDLDAFLTDMINRVRKGEMSCKTATTCAYLLTARQKARSQANWEKRLAALEEAMATRKRKELVFDLDRDPFDGGPDEQEGQ